MSRIRSRNTKPEMIVRSLIYNNGYRYRIHQKRLPGCPDIVFSKSKKVIFIHGCFWHYHKNCREGRIPSSNSEKWKYKLNNNVINDNKNKKKLLSMGWKVLVLWECEIERNIFNVYKQIKSFI